MTGVLQEDLDIVVFMPKLDVGLENVEILAVDEADELWGSVSNVLSERVRMERFHTVAPKLQISVEVPHGNSKNASVLRNMPVPITPPLLAYSES